MPAMPSVTVRGSALAAVAPDRAELSLADGLPTVEIELPLDRTVRKGDVLPVVLATVRLFGPR